VSCACTAAVLAGCTDASPALSRARATLRVHVGLFGGPPRPYGGMADSDAPQPDAPIRVTNDVGREWSATTGHDGIAAFSLRPGRYTITSPSCGRGPQPVVLKSKQRTYVEVRCDIP
jgi:hypothetical protein